MERGWNVSRGFSLIEVLVALGLLGLLAGSLVAFFSSLSERDAWARERLAQAAVGDVAIDRLSSSLRSTMVGGVGESAGVRGDRTSVRVLSRAVLGGSGLSDLASLSLTSNQGELTVVWSDARGAELVREDLSRGVRAMRLRYFDGRAWREEFDSGEAGRLPAAVEVSLWFGAASGNDDELPASRADRVRVVGIPDAGGGAS